MRVMPPKAASGPSPDGAVDPVEGSSAWHRHGRRLAFLGAVVLTLVLAFALAFAPLVRWAVDRRADALGIDVRVETIRAGLGAVHLIGVDAAPRWLPGVSVRLNQVTARVSATLSLSAIEIHGGDLRIRGSLSELRRRWLGRRGGGGGNAGGGRVAISVDGLGVRWEDAFEDGAVQRIWGLSYERAGDGAETLAADLLRVSAFGSGAEVGGLGITLARQGGARSLSAVSAQSVGAHVDVDGRVLRGLLRASDGSAKGAAAAPAQATPRRSRGVRLRAALADFAAALGSVLVPGAKVELAGVRAKFRKGGETLNVGPATFGVQRVGDRLTVRLAPGAGSAKSSVTLALDLPIGEGPVSVELAGGPVSLATLGVQEGDMGLADVAESRLEVRGTASLDAAGEFVDASGRYRLTDLALEHGKLSPHVVRGIHIGGSGRGRLALDGSRIVVEDAELSIGRVKMRLSADITRSEGRARGHASLSVPLGACQDLYDSTPRALLPDLEGMRFGGHFSFSSDLTFDTDRPADIDIGWKVDSACRIDAVPARVDPRRFRRPFRRVVDDGSGAPLEIESGPDTMDWVALHDISPHMETAVTVCEDARFRLHDGFDQKAILESIKDNVKAGRFVRGASTVTMQLAKNLYLERDKTLSRKLQEAVLTLLLEQELSKDEILELYLNVIEFGPGIYGIRRAAEHYFASEPSQLSLAQSMYLASILPNPKAGHFNPDGTLGERWRAYIERLVRIARKISRVTDEELDEALAEEIRFGQPAEATRDELLEEGFFEGVLEHEPGGASAVDARAPGRAFERSGARDSAVDEGDDAEVPGESQPTPGP